MKTKLLMLAVLFLTSLNIATAQNNRIIKGIVTEPGGQSPIIGASISVFSTDSMIIRGTTTNIIGEFTIEIPEDAAFLEVSYTGYKTTNVKIDAKIFYTIELELDMALDEIVIDGYRIKYKGESVGISSAKITQDNISAGSVPNSHSYDAPHETESKNHIIFHDKRFIPQDHDNWNNEQYGSLVENKFMSPLKEALSTFSIDVDRAGYSNIRRYIDNGRMPPSDAIRIEEMVNYFDYDYEGPSGKEPFAIHNTLTECPWNKDHHILHIGLQGKRVPTENLPPSNLVFLIDVSGSMSAQNKLPLLKASFKMLINQLRPEDNVAIVTYAGRAGVALESTSAKEKNKITNAIDRLHSGGSTAGAEGILTAYKIAKQNFKKGGNNRVILATDGDFNVGPSSNKELEKLIEKERKSGVFLSVLGYGMGNYKDEKMQILADKGNGNHAYIDNIQEARKVFVNEFGGTLFTIAKDVKIQIEFNPAYVQAYRLIGYENRMLKKEDFNDDTKDAGELGSGHTVTAIYEIVPAGVESNFVGNVDDLKYQEEKSNAQLIRNDEMATVKLRYKEPDGDTSKKTVEVVSSKVTPLTNAGENAVFSLAVAEFGLLLRDSDYLKDKNFGQIIDLASRSKNNDKEGYKAEFVRLVKSVMAMSEIASSEE